MNLQILVTRFGLKPEQALRLWALAGLQTPPADLAKHLTRLLGLAAALLLGAGAIFWIAANWQDWSRVAKFALLQSALLVALGGALLAPRGRTAALLLATLLLGALLAFIGQTYQTGADPWQLFAIWAVLALAWLLAARSDGLWVLWVIIASTGITLWSGARTDFFALLWFGSGWWQAGIDWLIWFALVGVAYALQSTGLAGNNPKWTLRTALLAAVIAVTGYAASALFSKQPQMYVFGLLLVGGTALLLWKSPKRDIAALCICVLGLDVLLAAAWGKLLFAGKFEIGSLFLFGLGAAGIVAASVAFLLNIYRDSAAKRLQNGEAA